MVRAATLGILAIVWLVPGAVAVAQTEESPGGPQIEDVDQPVGGIIPLPNSGAEPADPGDRGGALQLALLGLLVAFAVIAVWSIRRSSRKALKKRADSAAS
ncbi:MAG: hypothetical protein ACR2PK_16210 [Acidimicrobiales bacterium]